MDYKLQLPDNSCIHTVFHYSILNPFHPSSEAALQLVTLPSTYMNNQPVITPLAIIRPTPDPRLMVLVQ